MELRFVKIAHQNINTTKAYELLKGLNHAMSYIEDSTEYREIEAFWKRSHPAALDEDGDVIEKYADEYNEDCYIIASNRLMNEGKFNIDDYTIFLIEDDRDMYSISRPSK